jgi:hypothetical protein
VKELIMSRKQYSLRRQLTLATALALGASGAALADDSSMARLGGDSYAYFNQAPIGNVAATANWRQGHANGMTERELQALSSSDLSVFSPQFNPTTFARAAADPAWRQTHPNGLTERELQALSSSSLALWQAPGGSGIAIDQGSVAEASSRGSLSARLTNVFRRDSGSQPGPQ